MKGPIKLLPTGSFDFYRDKYLAVLVALTATVLADRLIRQSLALFSHPREYIVLSGIILAGFALAKRKSVIVLGALAIVGFRAIIAALVAQTTPLIIGAALLLVAFLCCANLIKDDSDIRAEIPAQYSIPELVVDLTAFFVILKLLIQVT